LLVKIIPNCVVSFIQNVLFFTTSCPAKAVQNCSIKFCEVTITIECNSRLVSANFSFAIIDHLIISFGISKVIYTRNGCDIRKQFKQEKHFQEMMLHLKLYIWQFKLLQKNGQSQHWFCPLETFYNRLWGAISSPYIEHWHGFIYLL